MFQEPESNDYLELDTQSPSVPPFILWVRAVRPDRLPTEGTAREGHGRHPAVCPCALSNGLHCAHGECTIVT